MKKGKGKKTVQTLELTAPPDRSAEVPRETPDRQSKLSISLLYASNF
jgi:hypothetical protein